MDVDTDFMARIHREQKKRRKHKRSHSDWTASPTDKLSYDPSQTGDADLLVIPDTPRSLSAKNYFKLFCLKI